MSAVQSLNDFFAAWTEEDPDGRANLIGSAIGEGFYYLDPQTPEPITSGEAMSGYADMFRQNCPPGAKCEVIEPVDEKGGHARATVRFIMNADQQMTGQYFIDHDADGKITRMVGFVGKGAE